VEALFQSAEFKLVAEFLISNKMLLVDEVLEKKYDTTEASALALSRASGYSRALDDLFGLSRILKQYKLKDQD